MSLIFISSFLAGLRLASTSSMSSTSSSRIIAVTRRLPSHVLSPLIDSGFRVITHDSDEPPSRSELLSLVSGASAIVCTLADGVDATLLAAAGPSLRGVATMSVGTSHIDSNACAAANVRVGFTPGVLTAATADLTITLLLATLRRVPEALAAAKNGNWTSWKPYWLAGRDLSHSTVGIIGFGRIGEAVGRRLRGFDCSILYNTRSNSRSAESDAPLNAKWATLNELLSNSDIVICLCPLTEETRGLIGAAQIALMKPISTLINVARGEIIVQDALVAALQTRPGLRAGLDVTTPEPLPLDHPLLHLNNSVIFPHIGSASLACRDTMASLTIANAIGAANGTKMPEETTESISRFKHLYN